MHGTQNGDSTTQANSQNGLRPKLLHTQEGVGSLGLTGVWRTLKPRLKSKTYKSYKHFIVVGEGGLRFGLCGLKH